MNSPIKQPSYNPDFLTRSVRLAQLFRVSGGLVRRLAKIKLLRDPVKVNQANLALAEWCKFQALSLGPTFIKLLQNISTRQDLLPSQFIEVFSTLQDQVETFDFDLARQVIEGELGGNLEELFLSIDKTPIAAASIGQIYRVRSLDGAEKIVKVQRPGIELVIALDLTLLRVIIQHLQVAVPRLAEESDAMSIIDDLTETFRQELDFTIEADNVEEFVQMFADPSERVLIPSVDRNLSSTRVLTLDYLPGIKLSNFKGSSTQIKEVAEIILVAFLKQLVAEGVFHADPHAGNIAVTLDTEGNPRVILYDFGMIGRLTKKERESLLKIGIAAIKEDVDGLIAVCVEAGILGVSALESLDVRRVMLRFISKLDKLSADSVIELREKLSRVSERGGLKFPAEFMLVGRTLSAIEGNMGALQRASAEDLQLSAVVLSQTQAMGAQFFPEPVNAADRVVYDVEQLKAVGLQILKASRRGFYQLENGTLKIPVADEEVGRAVRRLNYGFKSQNALILWLGFFVSGMFFESLNQRGPGDSLVTLSLVFLERWLQAERRLDS